MTNAENARDNALQPTTPSRLWSYLLGVVVFQILNALYWAFVGGLGWGFGSAVGSHAGWPGAGLLGGAAGLALVLFAVLTINPTRPVSEYTPIQLAIPGAAAAACASLALASALGRDWIILLGGVAGFVLGVLTIVLKQYFAPVRVLPACVLAVTGSAVFAGIGILLEGPLGWAAAGALALFGTAMLAECFRQEPAVEIDASGQPVREVPKREMLRHTARQSWHPTGPVAWGWHGWFAGLAASLWAAWAADQPNQDAVRQTFLVCGGLAAFMVLFSRLGLVKPPTKPVDKAQMKPTDESAITNDQGITKPQ